MRRIVLIVAMSVVVPIQANASSIKEGWSKKQIESMASEISSGMIKQAEKDYFLRAEEKGNPNPKPFPLEETKASVDTMVTCVVNRASTQWSYNEFMKNQMVYFKNLFGDAFSGGKCKPTGLLGKALSHSKK